MRFFLLVYGKVFLDMHKLGNDIEMAAFSAKAQCSLLFTLNLMALWFLVQSFIKVDVNDNVVKGVLLFVGVSFFFITSKLSKKYTLEDYKNYLE